MKSWKEIEKERERESERSGEGKSVEAGEKKWEGARECKKKRGNGLLPQIAKLECVSTDFGA